MATQARQTLDRLEQVIIALITNEGTPAERLIDAYELLSVGLQRAQLSTGRLLRRARRLKRELDQYAAARGLGTPMAIALMDGPAVAYWSTRMLGLPIEAGSHAEFHSDGQTQIASE